jgi:O-antigen/teichoic acid export membrane protein
VSRVVLLLVVLANALMLARVLHPEGFGQYFLFLRVVSVLAALADLGLSQSANAFYGRHADYRRNIHWIVLRLVPICWLGVTALGCLFILVVGSTLLPNLSPFFAVLAFVVLPFSLYANIWNSMMVGMGQIWRVNLLQVFMCTLSLTLSAVFVVALKGGVKTAVLVYLAVMIIQFLVMLTMQLRAKYLVQEPQPDLAQTMIFFGLRAYPGSLGHLLLMRMPVFVINVTHGPAAVGIFSVAQQAVEKILLPVEATQDSVYQKMSTLGRSQATLALNRYLRLTWWGLSGLVIVGILSSYAAVMLLLGPAYAPAIGVMQILFLGSGFVALSLLLDTFFINQLHRPGLVSILVWLKFGLGLILTLLLTPKFGVKGAAVAMTITQVLGAFLYVSVYLQATSSRARELLHLETNDLALLKAHVSAAISSRSKTQQVTAGPQQTPALPGKQ